MLKTAKKMLLRILEVLREDIRQGTPVVGLEPSCVAVFRDELCDMLPHDEDAKRLKQQTYRLAEFLEKKVDYSVLNAGCCGMAGYFGYEKGAHYDVSVKVGKRVLLPEVRKAAPDTLIIADGFSCREQIKQQTIQKGLHLAQVLQLAIHANNKAPSDAGPCGHFDAHPNTLSAAEARLKVDVVNKS